MKSILLFLIVGISSGCSTTMQLHSINEARNKIEGRSGTLSVNADAGQYDARDIRIGADSTVFLDLKAYSMRHIANTDVASVKIVQRGGGAFEGLIVGGLCGLLAGYQNAVHERTGLGGLYVGGIGGVVVGATVGYLIGHRHNFVFRSDSVLVSQPIRDNGIDHAGEQRQTSFPQVRPDDSSKQSTDEESIR